MREHNQRRTTRAAPCVPAEEEWRSLPASHRWPEPDPLLPRLLYFDAHQEKIMRDSSQPIRGYASESWVEARTSESYESDTEWHWALVTVTHLPAPAEGDEAAAELNFGDGPS